jgi:hypothetical protein
MWNVNWWMLDIVWKNESLRNDVVISDNILNVYVFKVNSLASDLPRDGSIADIENMRIVIWDMD